MDTDANTNNIDALLERYLHLLHEYTQLRERLGSLQAGVYHNLARANFAAERGMRYGQDHFDERMQASRRVRVSVSAAAAAPSFTVSLEGEEEDLKPTPKKSADKADEASGAPGVDGGLGGSEGEKKKGDDGAAGEAEDDAELEKNEEKEARKKKQTQSKDPLRWFGLLAPMALRQAQAQSIQAVGEIVPRLVSVDAEMAQVEIEVRRARKRRAKAEAAKEKLELGQQQQEGPVARASEIAA